MFKKREDVALRDVVSGHGGNGLTIELDNLGGLSNLNDSMIAGTGCHTKCLPLGLAARFLGFTSA